MNPAEFRQWYESVAPDLYRYVTRICESAEESEDVFQEAFTRFLGSGFTSDHAADRRCYLFQIATNQVRDRRRRSRRWQFGELLDRGGSTPEREYGHRIDVERALSQLPPRSRAVLWLAYANDIPHKEIAEIVGVATTSVKVLLSRARKKFLEHIERADP